MRPFAVFARILITVAVLVLALRGYAPFETASTYADASPDGDIGGWMVDGIATALRDFGILLALAGAMIALDRTS